MGQPKMILPWASTTVLGRVLEVLAAAGVGRTLVVTGAARAQVEQVCLSAGVANVYNPDYEAGEMLSSLQAGLRGCGPEWRAALVVLGDQPGIQEVVVRAVMERYRETSGLVVIPSYSRRRGHPWLVSRELW